MYNEAPPQGWDEWSTLIRWFDQSHWSISLFSEVLKSSYMGRFDGLWRRFILCCILHFAFPLFGSTTCSTRNGTLSARVRITAFHIPFHNEFQFWCPKMLVQPLSNSLIFPWVDKFGVFGQANYLCEQYSAPTVRSSSGCCTRLHDSLELDYLFPPTSRLAITPVIRTLSEAVYYVNRNCGITRAVAPDWSLLDILY